jgi:hypothetical protein
MPGKSKSRRAAVTRSLKTTFLQKAVFSATIVNSAAGVYSAAFQATEFGLGPAATFQVTCPQFTIGSGVPSSCRLRLKSMRVDYLPYNGRSVSYGAGSGVATVIDSSNVPTINFSNIAQSKRVRYVYVGKPFQLTWRPTTNVDRLWVSSVVAQTAFLPLDNTTVGATFMVYTAGGVNVAIIGTLLFSFLLEVEMY